LLINHRLGVLDGFCAYFVSSVDGHVMHDEGVAAFEQLGVDLVGHHELDALFLFRRKLWVSEELHVYPCVGVNEIRIRNRFFDVQGGLPKPSLLRLREQLVVSCGFVKNRRNSCQFHACFGAAFDKRVGNVVVDADVN